MRIKRSLVKKAILVVVLFFVTSPLWVILVSDYVFNLAKDSATKTEPISSITRDTLWSGANKLRTSPLALDPVLNDTAQNKCDEISASGVFDHGNLQALANNLNKHVGENLAEGYNTTEDVLRAWEASPTHKANLINPDWTRVGYGICDSSKYGVIVVQHFSE